MEKIMDIEGKQYLAVCVEGEEAKKRLTEELAMIDKDMDNLTRERARRQELLNQLG